MKRIALPTALMTIKFLFFSLTFFFIPIYLVNIGMNGFEVGTLMGIWVVTALLASFFVGLLSDRVTIKDIVILGLLINALFYYLITITNNFILLALIFFIGGFGNSLVDIPVQSLIYKTLDKKRSGISMGTYYGVSTLGAALGMLIGGYLLDSIDFSPVFRITAVSFLCLIPLAYLMAKNKTYESKIAEYKLDLYKTKVFFLMIVVFLFTLHWGAENTVYSLYLVTNLALTKSGAGIFMAIPIFVLGIASFWVGKRLDIGIKPITVLTIGLILSGVGHIVLAYPDLIIAFIARVVHEIGDAFLIIFIFVSIYKLFPRSRIGGLSAAITTVMILGRFVGSLIFAPMGTEFGYGIPLAVSGAIMLAVLGLVYYKKEYLEA